MLAWAHYGGYYNQQTQNQGFQQTTTFEQATVVRIYEPGAVLHVFRPEPYVATTNIAELSNSLVVFDSQPDPQVTASLVRYLQSLNKPVVRIILSHYHFDHWVGLNGLRQAFPNAPIYALSATISRISSFYANGQPNNFQAAAQQIVPFLTPITPGYETIDGVRFYYNEIFNTENPNTLMTVMPRQQVVVTADMVGKNRHMFVAEAQDFNNWISTVQNFQRYLPYRNYLPSHGDPLTSSELPSAIEYLTYVRDLVATNPTPQAYVSSLTTRFPNHEAAAIIPCRNTQPACLFGNF